MAVHIDDFEAEALDDEVFPFRGYSTEEMEDKTAKRVELIELLSGKRAD